MRLAPLFTALIFFAVAAACSSSDATPTATPDGGAQPTSPTNTVMQPPVDEVPTPDFTLPLASDGSITFSDYRGVQPVAVVFYRGFF